MKIFFIALLVEVDSGVCREAGRDGSGLNRNRRAKYNTT